ncbi:MAG: gas vesicle protein GvpG [Syntrophobacteraceae bacterium]
MLIVDDILCFPLSGILWIFREVHKAVEQEQAAETETITAELMDLHMMLDTGKITTEEFDAREKELLDRLDEMEEQGTRGRRAE